MKDMLSQHAGKSGYVTDELFKSVVQCLEDNAVFVEEEEQEGYLSNYVATTYRDKRSEELYQLIYQVRNVKTPLDYHYVFTFVPA